MPSSDSLTQAKTPDQRLRILFLVPFVPDPNAAHGGGRVVGQLVKHLAARHRVALCYLRAAGETVLPPIFTEQCEIVEEVAIPAVGTTKLERLGYGLKVWAQLLAGKPLWASDRWLRPYQERVRYLVHSWSPDIIQAEYHIMGQYLSACAGSQALRILVQHEPGVEAARQGWHSGAIPGRLMPWLNLLAWQRFERAVMQQAQAAVVFTERDRQMLLKVAPQKPIVCIPFGTEIPTLPFDPVGDRPFRLLFIGNFRHPPNTDAALRLINHILPLVQPVFPEIRLYIVGSDPPAEVRQRANARIIVTGYVPNLKPYLDKAALFVAPIRMGGGMRVKVLEALAGGKTVIASPLAAEGLDVVDGEQIILAESDQQFAEAIIQLLAAPDRRAAVATCARAWASTHRTWDSCVAGYEQLYRSLLIKNNSNE